jgi:hypothetical protein
MGEDHFEVVTIETDEPGRLINVTSTRQVAERLTKGWPAARRGAAYTRAVKACMDNFSGKKNIEAVRAALIDAAKEADIFVREGARHE